MLCGWKIGITQKLVLLLATIASLCHWPPNKDLPKINNIDALQTIVHTTHNCLEWPLLYIIQEHWDTISCGGDWCSLLTLESGTGEILWALGSTVLLAWWRITANQTLLKKQVKLGNISNLEGLTGQINTFLFVNCHYACLNPWKISVCRCQSWCYLTKVPWL